MVGKNRILEDLLGNHLVLYYKSLFAEALIGEGSTLMIRAIPFFGCNEGTRIAREKGRALRINPKSCKTFNAINY